MTFFLFWFLCLLCALSPCRSLSSHSVRSVPKGWQIEMNKLLTTRENVESLMDLFERHGLAFDVVNLATTCHRIAKLSKKTDASRIRLDPLAAACRKNMHLFDAKGLAITAWAFATLNVEDEGLLDDLADHAGIQAYRCKGLEIANLVWAYARMGRRTDLFDRLAVVAVDRMDTFSPQNVANVAWAYAKSGSKAPELFDAIANIVPMKIGAYTTQGLANVLWAFSTIGHDAPLLFDAVADAAIKGGKVNDFNPQDLSNIAWAFGKKMTTTTTPKTSLSPAGRELRELLFQRIADRAAVLIPHFKPQELSNIAWAFAKSGIEAPRLFHLIARTSLQKVSLFKPRELANLLYAFVKLGHVDPDLFATVALYHQQHQRQHFSPQELSDLAWAFATAGQPAPSVFNALHTLIDQTVDGAPGADEKTPRRDLGYKNTAHNTNYHHRDHHYSKPLAASHRRITRGR